MNSLTILTNHPEAYIPRNRKEIGNVMEEHLERIKITVKVSRVDNMIVHSNIQS